MDFMPYNVNHYTHSLMYHSISCLPTHIIAILQSLCILGILFRTFIKSASASTRNDMPVDSMGKDEPEPGRVSGVDAIHSVARHQCAAVA